MNYRKATKEDTYQLSQMRLDFQTETDEEKSVWSKEDFIKSCGEFYKNMISSENWLFWVAEKKDEINAHVSLLIVDNIPIPSKKNNRWGYLTNTYTKKSYRNKGIGSKLVKHITDEAKKMEVETIIVWPSDKSVDFYEKVGFSRENDVMELKNPKPSGIG